MAAISAQAQSTKPAVDSEVEATAQTAESIEDRIAQAAILIESALIGDVLQVWYSPSATSDARRQNFIRWYRQHVEGGSGIRWRRAFVLITSLHTSVLAIYVLLSFVERPSWCYDRTTEAVALPNGTVTKIPPCGDPTVVLVSNLPVLAPWLTQTIELLCLAYLTLEMAIKYKYHGHQYWTRPRNWNLIKATLIVFAVADVVYTFFQFGGLLPGTFRLAPLLRPLVWMSMERSLRRIVVLLGRIFAACAKVLFLLGFVIVWFGACMFVVYDQFCIAPCDRNKYFPNLRISVVSIFTLLSTENYPDVMIGGFIENRAFSIFYILFLLLVEFFLLRVVLAKVYLTYKAQLEDEAHAVAQFRESALDLAFDIMISDRAVSSSDLKAGSASLPLDEAAIDVDTFCRLIVAFSAWSKGLHQMHLDLDGLGKNMQLTDKAMRLIDANSDKSISRSEFHKLFMHLPEIHDMCEHVANSLSEETGGAPPTFTLCSGKLAPERKAWMQQIIKSHAFLRAMNAVCMANAVTVILEITYEYLPSREAGTSLAKPWWIAVELCFCALYGAEMWMRLAAAGSLSSYFSCFSNRFAAAVTVVSILGEFSMLCDFGSGDGTIRIVIFIRLARLLRLFVDVQEFSHYFTQLRRLWTPLQRLLLAMLLIMFAFAELGITLFGGKITSTARPLDGTSFEADKYYINNFNDLLMGMICLWNVLVGNNWNEVADGFVAVTNQSAWLYFITYYVVCNMIVFNTFVAYVLEYIEFDEVAELEHELGHDHEPSQRGASPRLESAGSELPKRFPHNPQNIARFERKNQRIIDEDLAAPNSGDEKMPSRNSMSVERVTQP